LSARLYDALVLDVDSTLLDDHDRVHPRTRAAIERARQDGVRVLLATGRSAGGAREVLGDLQLDAPAVVYNGAAVYCPVEDRVIESYALPESLVARMLDHTSRKGLLPVVALATGAQYARPGRTAEEQRVLTDFRVLSIVDEPALPRAGAIRLTVLSDRHRDPYVLRAEIEGQLDTPAYLTHFALAALPRFRDSALQVVDIQPDCAGKAEVFRVLEARYGIPPARVVAVGDAGNDVPMLRGAGLAVAMGNATAEAQSVAHHVIGDNNGDALGRLIEDVFFGQG
jgi:5-amino-6-(5-phospho-D-ribitylamino)uracil phosphatase